MKLLITIVERHLSDRVAKITGGETLDYQIAIPAVGTAPSEIREYLSLGDSERDLLMSLVDDEDVETIFQRLISDLGFLKSGMGVAFTVSLDGISESSYRFIYREMEGIENGR